KIQLIGYSGGGGLASLLAARRNDVSSLVTVAAVLDSEWWTGSWLPDSQQNALNLSLNPVDWAAHFATLPQRHFSGSQDRLVPPIMVERLQNAASFENFQHIILNNTHTHGWQESWPRLLNDHIIPLRSGPKPSAAPN
ncbi:MAG: hypothetical protein IJD04_05500, partial [Desulfovibrionaceae bacterium]|nr:hypothetical protein [Desulfovibrionaceae bacterium]